MANKKADMNNPRENVETCSKCGKQFDSSKQGGEADGQMYCSTECSEGREHSRDAAYKSYITRKADNLFDGEDDKKMGGSFWEGNCKNCGKPYRHGKTWPPSPKGDACEKGYCSTACESDSKKASIKSYITRKASAKI